VKAGFKKNGLLKNLLRAGRWFSPALFPGNIDVGRGQDAHIHFDNRADRLPKRERENCCSCNTCHSLACNSGRQSAPIVRLTQESCLCFASSNFCRGLGMVAPRR